MSRQTPSRRSARRLFLAAFALLLIAPLLSVGPAVGHTATRNDGNDSPGRLDIRSASVGHANNRVVHTVRTYDGWTPRSLGNDSFLIIEIDKNFDNDFERCAFIFFAGGRLRGSLTNCGRTFIRQLPVSKPSPAVARVTIPTADTGQAYRWVAFSYWTGLPARCSDLCFDAAPNRPPPILHDLIPPVVTMPSDPLRAWEGASGNDAVVNFPFSLSDPGGSSSSGLATWSIQGRSIGSPVWADAGVSGTGGGAKEPTINGVEGTGVDYRVVAVDKHGNRTISPSRRVYIPTDEDDLDPVGFSDPPVEVSDTSAFGGTLTEMSTGTFTYTWTPGTDCLFELIGPGFGDYWVQVTVDGGTTHNILDDYFPDEPRLTLFSNGDGEGAGICGSEYVVTWLTGTFALDAVLASSD